MKCSDGHLALGVEEEGEIKDDLEAFHSSDQNDKMQINQGEKNRN